MATASSPRPTCWRRRRRAAGRRLDPGRRHAISRRPDRLELRRQYQQSDRSERPRHVHRGGDRCRQQQRNRRRGGRLDRADHAGAVSRLLGQRDRRRGRRGHRVCGRPRGQGHQRQLGWERDGPHDRRGDPVRKPARRDHRCGRRQQRRERRHQLFLPGLVFIAVSQPDLGRGDRQQRRAGFLFQLRDRHGSARRARGESNRHER